MAELKGQKMEGFGSRCGRTWLANNSDFVTIQGTKYKVTPCYDMGPNSKTYTVFVKVS